MVLAIRDLKEFAAREPEVAYRAAGFSGDLKASRHHLLSFA
jgi:hypothetical protein